MNQIEKILAEKIIELKQSEPFVVCFDGVDTAGKTILANKVDDELRKRDCDSIRVSIDKFHNPRDERTKQGNLSPKGYFEDSFNIEKIKEYVLEPIRAGGARIVSGIYDYKTEKEIDRSTIKITDKSIILFDGIFLNRDELFGYWNLSIFLDITFENVLIRALERDVNLFGNGEEIENRYTNRYIPGQKLYMEKCKPKERAHIVIDNNDYRNPQITKENYT